MSSFHRKAICTRDSSIACSRCHLDAWRVDPSFLGVVVEGVHRRGAARSARPIRRPPRASAGIPRRCRPGWSLVCIPGERRRRRDARASTAARSRARARAAREGAAERAAAAAGAGSAAALQGTPYEESSRDRSPEGAAVEGSLRLGRLELERSDVAAAAQSGRLAPMP